MPNDSGLSYRTIDRDLVDLALSGLSGTQKTLPAKLFYDETGCRLFYRITELDEYYLTRVEGSILPQAAAETLAMLSASGVLVEYGASDEAKAAILLREPAIRAYVPIDVALPELERMQARLAHSHPHVAVHPIAADFTGPVTLPSDVADVPRLGFFPGSTIGNLEPSEAKRFLAQARATLGSDSRFLIGVDLRKDPSILLPAYDDAAGVTAEFNRNVLVRLNREAGANFDVSAFAHRALWNDSASRIEMHLVSARDQSIRIAGHAIRFTRGETIHTENSYKHTPEGFAQMANAAGWHQRQMWTDAKKRFALFLLEP